jgi:SH3-like domain-containing protein
MASILSWGVRIGLLLGPIALLLLLPAGAAPAGELAPVGPASGLPLPRFVSLKSDHVNVRRGPHKEHEVVWVYVRAALPVEITAEYENWRRIRDWDGGEGWVYHSLLSGRRTAVVLAKTKDKGELLALFDSPQSDAVVAARLQPGVLATVKSCSGEWCRIAGEGFDGFIEQGRLWGVYLNEKIE